MKRKRLVDLKCVGVEGNRMLKRERVDDSSGVNENNINGRELTDPQWRNYGQTIGNLYVLFNQ